MPFTGRSLDVAVIFLVLWLALLCRTTWRLLRIRCSASHGTPREWLTVVGMGCSAVAVGALLALHLTWLSVSVSQRLGVTAIHIIAMFLFWPTLVGLIFSSAGFGRIRLLGMGTSLATGYCWLVLSIGAAISMGAPAVRHPIRFLIPDEYVGWVEVKYADSNAPPLPMDRGTLICRFPDSGVLRTSSLLEKGRAKDTYFYYSEDGSLRAVPDTSWGRGGMIRGQQNTTVEQYVYIGTEDQFHRGVRVSQLRPPP